MHEILRPRTQVGELGHEGMSVFAQENNPVPIDRDVFFGGESVSHIGCGFQHSVATTDAGTIMSLTMLSSSLRNSCTC